MGCLRHDRVRCIAIIGALAAALVAPGAALPASGSATKLDRKLARSSKAPHLRNVRRPMMSGVGAVGGRLAASTGAWSGPIASIAIRWERCTRTGLRCRVVARRRAVYRVVGADAGFALRVVVSVVGEDRRTVEAASHLLPIRR